MAIVDIHGRPIKFEQTAQTEQDSKLGPLQRHYSEHPTIGLSPGRAAQALREAELGNLIMQCELAEDMEEKDSHLQSELGKRRRALLDVKWNIKPPRNADSTEIRDAEMIAEVLQDMTWLEDLIFDASDAVLKGFSCQEFIGWQMVDGLQLPIGAEWRDPAWFMTHPDNRNELRLRDSSYAGVGLQPFGWVMHRAKSKSGYLSRNGLIRTLVWPFLFKNYSVRDLAEFLEIYGLPVRLGKYPEGATETEKNTLLQAVLSIGHNAGGIIPRGMEIDFQNAANGQADPFVVMMDWCERSISKAILGGTLTSQADGKSSTNALGEVHDKVRMEVRDADLRQLAATLTRDLVYPIFALNGKSYRSASRLPRLEFETQQPQDMRDIAVPLRTLVSIGMRIPTKWAHERLQIPEPAGKEDVLALQEPYRGGQDPAALSAKTRGLAVLSAEQTTPDNVDLQIDQLREQAGALLASMTAEVRKLVVNATSLEQLRDGILSLEQDISHDDLGNLLAKAITASELLGMLEMEEGR